MKSISQVKVLFTILILMGCKDNFKVGQQALDIQDYPRAQAYFEQHLDEDPNHVEARKGLILSLVGQINQSDTIPAQMWKQVERELQICERSAKDKCLPAVHFKYNYEMARWNFQTSRDKEALTFIERAESLEHLPTDQVKLKHLKASILIELSRMEEALGLLYVNVEQDSTHKESFILLAAQLVEMNEFMEALLILDQAEGYFPQDARVAFWMNEALEGELE